MKAYLVLFLFIVIIIGGFFYPIISYLILYQKAKKKWLLIEGVKIDEVAYPRSFGGVSKVEYQFINEVYKVEVYKAYFSTVPNDNKVMIMVNPDNPEKCIQVNKPQIVKNIISLIILGFIFFLGFVYLLIEVFKR